MHAKQTKRRLLYYLDVASSLRDRKRKEKKVKYNAIIEEEKKGKRSKENAHKSCMSKTNVRHVSYSGITIFLALVRNELEKHV